MEFLSKNISEMVFFFNLRDFFLPFFEKMHIFAIYRNLKEVVS